jgi:hypothetical protein
MGDQHGGGFFEPETAYKYIQGLPYQGGEDSVKVKTGEVRHSGEGFQIQLGVYILFNEVDHPIDPSHVLLTQQLFCSRKIDGAHGILLVNPSRVKRDKGFADLLSAERFLFDPAHTGAAPAQITA